jgi:hypothetical protein
LGDKRAVTTAEFEALLADPSKRIDEDILWDENKSLPHVVDFRIRVKSEDYHLVIKGSHNRTLGKTSYTLFIGDLGRLFSVDYDRRHGIVGHFHCHRWDGESRKCIASPASVSDEIGRDPNKLWVWFCKEANIAHNGILHAFPPQQGELYK